MANAIILVPTSFTTALTSFGYSYNPPGSYDLIVGKTYTVVWDETEYTVTAMDGSSLMPDAVFIGNIKPYYPEMDTKEPFLIGEVGGGLLIVCVDDTAPTTHNVTIYTEADVTEEPSFDIALKDRDGIENFYPATVVRLKTRDGAVRRFINADAVPEPEEVTVDLDMADGDQVITPSAENKVLSRVTIKKPETLVPENIATDVDVGGIVGTFEGGPGTGAYSVQVIDHDGTVLAEKNIDSGEVFELPNAPEHEGLIFDGWSSPVVITDNTVTVENQDITIGPMYHTESGATEVDIVLTKATGLTFAFFSSKLTGMTSIDWGDGTTNSTLTHTYSNYGEYTIKIYGLTAIANGGSSGGIVSVSTTAPNFTIKNVRFSSKVTTIGSYAFYYCRSLSSVVFPNGVTKIGDRAFMQCMSLGNGNVTIPPGASIGTYAFQNCLYIKRFAFPQGCPSVPDYILSSCPRLTSVTIPKSVTSIGAGAFQSCSALQRVIIPDGVTSIVDSTFYYNYSLESVTIPESVTSIGKHAFSNIRVKSITIPKNVKSIGSACFNGASTLIEVDCTACTSVPTLVDTTVFTANGILQILVPSSLYSAWVAATNWSTYANYIVAV